MDGFNCRITPGHGFWDITNHPIGGKFMRAPKNADEAPLLFKPGYTSSFRGYGPHAVGTTPEGRTIAIAESGFYQPNPNTKVKP